MNCMKIDLKCQDLKVARILTIGSINGFFLQIMNIYVGPRLYIDVFLVYL
jgi:hypothetical protein